MGLTTEQILALAPDAASAKAGAQHANPGKWSGLGANETALWGLCQGSGKDPYRSQIEFAEPAFKCSCPSRKFPCKHTLGLYLLYAQNTSAFADSATPPWVSDWLESRNQRAEKKAAKAAEADMPASPEEAAAKERSRQKRQEKRSSNVLQGLDAIDTWLADLAREGVAGLKSKPAKEWESMAARMVDCQASGLATRLRRASSLVYGGSSATWEIAVARELAMLAMLTQSYRRAEHLPQGLQYDVKTAVGWTATQEEALAEAGIRDTWHVHGNCTQQDERIRRRASYLRGQESGRWAMLLQFSAGAQQLASPLVPGSQYLGSMHFYPSAAPLRAVLGTDMQVLPIARTAAMESPAPAHPEAQLTDYAQALAANPFIEQYPLHLRSVVPHHMAAPSPAWYLRFTDGSALPIASSFQHGWRLHALAGGAPVEIFGLWDGTAFLPLAATIEDQVHSLDVEVSA
jgi:hypothetical protein